MITLGGLAGFAVLCCATGFLFGWIARDHARRAPDARPREVKSPLSPPAELPRPGYLELWPTVPERLQSDHDAAKAATIAAIAKMIEDNPVVYQ